MSPNADTQATGQLVSRISGVLPRVGLTDNAHVVDLDPSYAYSQKREAGPFREEVMQVGDIAVKRLAADPVKVRLVRGSAPSKVNLFALGIVTSGSLTVGEVQLSAGECAVVPYDSLGTIDVLEPTSGLVIVCPQSVVKSFGVKVPEALTVVRGRDDLVVPLRALTDALFEAEKYDGFSAYIVHTTFERFIAALLVEGGDRRSSSRPVSSTADFAMNTIRKSYRDHEFGLNQLAKEMAVSSRQVQRVLAELNISVTKEIRKLRCAHACRLLADYRAQVLDISQIAKESGFSSAAHMREAFRVEGIEAPSAIRKRAELERREELASD